MKKLIVGVCILVVMLAVAISEIYITNSFFVRLQDSLVKVEISMAENPKQFDNPETIQKMEETLHIWKKNRNYMLIASNHLTMRNLDEKLVMLKTQIEINADQDAPVTLSVVMNYVCELRKEGWPKLINIF